MKVALVGYGYWGKIVRKYIENSRTFELVKIYSSRKNGSDIITDDISEIVHSEEIKAVFICTPIETHFQLCSLFLKNNKHVFCEKPTVKSIQEFCFLKKIAMSQQKILFTDYIYLVSPSIIKLKELLNEIGSIIRVEGWINQYGKFYQDADVFEVLGVHMLSIMQFLFPSLPVENIEYSSDFEKNNCVDGKIMIQYKNSFKAELRCSLVYPQKERCFVIWGESGILYFNMCNAETVQYFKIRKEEEEVVNDNCMKWAFDEANNLSRVITEFYNCIETMDVKNLLLSEKVLELLERRLD